MQANQNLPVKNILHPMMGMRKLLVLETNLNERLRWNRVKMSCTAIRTSGTKNCILLFVLNMAGAHSPLFSFTFLQVHLV